MSGIIARMRSFLSGARRRPQLDQEMDDEFRHHMELRAADLQRTGLSGQEATRQARLEFGSTERYKDKGAESRGLRRFDQMRVSMLDFKLGARMLVKYPGLTIVGGLAIAFAITVGSGTFEVVRQAAAPTLPWPGADRILGIEYADVETGKSRAATARDFVAWRNGIASLEYVGAYRQFSRNFRVGNGAGEPVTVAEISAAAFPLGRIPPLLGRTIVPADEALDAPEVVVIGYHIWKNRLHGDSTVIGRVVSVGGVQATVVGVMPKGYEFPMYHSAWMPLRLGATTAAAQLAQPMDNVFARLKPGRSMREAQAELTQLGERAAADFPDTHRHLRPRVLPYAETYMRLDPTETKLMFSMNLLVGMLLVLVCANVALLMFARAMTRQTEIVVRSALGAGRSRIVLQLFAEALVLACVAAVVGLTVTHFAMQGVRGVLESNISDLPFWFTLELSPMSYAYAGTLTLLAAFIAGAVPGLKVTSGGIDGRLRAMTAGGGGPKFGGMWTATIIAQVALTVAFPVVAYFVHGDAKAIEQTKPGFAANEYLAVNLQMDRDSRMTSADTSSAAFRSRFAARYNDLFARLSAEPGVRGVTYARWLPLMYHPHRMMSLDAGPAAPINPDFPGGYRVSSVAVDARFFDVIGAKLRQGRNFTAADADTTQRTVLVNEEFVRRVMGGHNPVGRRLRFTYFEGELRRPDREPGPWHEIVGVVENVGIDSAAHDPKVARIYHPAQPDGVYPMHMAIHVPGGPAGFSDRLREIAAAVDPALRIIDPKPLDRMTQPEIRFLGMWFRILLAVSAVALGLSLAGIYAVMAFAVSKRTREIGVRVALGASPVRVIRAVFARPLIQVTLGILAGAVLTTGLVTAADSSNFSIAGAATLIVYVLFMLVVCLLACVVPTHRALRIQPTEALRAES
ncbi:MAG TPA: ABC transporter permease [Gemmatimonadaceae bacterium]|nr:ABC transporter permease [Gemmatimonadaceae bacterium]